MINILLIDDSTFICNIVTNTLSSNKTNVLTTMTAQDTYHLLKSVIPDLILLSVVLPDANGYEVCHSLKQMHKLKSVPIIFITANTDVNSIVQGFEAGATDYIGKPFSTAELMARVSCHLQNKLMSDELKTTNQKLLKMMEELKMQGYKDALTGIYNRRYFTEHVACWKEQMVRTHSSACLFMVDIDYFKSINDTYGHSTGDYVLRTIADMLMVKSPENSAVIRWGGDEFLIIIFAVSLPKAIEIGNQLKEHVSHHPIEYNDEQISCSLTIGVTEFHLRTSVEENLNLADRALYIGKERGRNCCISELDIIPN